jgi:outer membrane protein OmpA-like peptidoglycan-associated protein
MQANKRPDADLSNVRSLLLGNDNEVVLKSVEKNARQIVSDVVTEAIYDRERRDGSLARTITPMIESSIQQSIDNNKSKFIDYLYPIMGGLVRKSVAVFFDGFVEKLNYLIEYGLTIKGIKWRLEARAAGIPFPQYLLLKTFKYRVEQVFLIHKETGALICSIQSPGCEYNEPSLVASMLTAINDFVIDSFNSPQAEGLQSIQSDNLSILISSSDKIIIAVAATGTAPSHLKTKMDKSLEEIHNLYSEALHRYDGDNSELINAENHLQRCMVSEIDNNVKRGSRKVSAYLILGSLLLLLVAFAAHYWWQEAHYINKINQLDNEPGVELLSAEHVGWNSFAITLLKDEQSRPMAELLSRAQLKDIHVEVKEKAYFSTDERILSKKVAQLLADQPAIKFTLKENVVSLSGNAQSESITSIAHRVLTVPGINKVDSTQLKNATPLLLSPLAKKQLLQRKLASLATYSLTFEVASLTLEPSSKLLLDDIAADMKLIFEAAKQQDISIGIIISGFTDNTGNKTNNVLLSDERAQLIKSELINRGVNKSILHAVGIGELSIPDIAEQSRKVIFSSIQLPSPKAKDLQ